MNDDRLNKPVRCPDCDALNVKPITVMTFPEWGKKNNDAQVMKKYQCLECGLEFELPSSKEQLEMKNGMTLLIVVAIMIVMLLIVLR